MCGGGCKHAHACLCVHAEVAGRTSLFSYKCVLRFFILNHCVSPFPVALGTFKVLGKVLSLEREEKKENQGARRGRAHHSLRAMTSHSEEHLEPILTCWLSINKSLSLLLVRRNSTSHSQE